MSERMNTGQPQPVTENAASTSVNCAFASLESIKTQAAYDHTAGRGAAMRIANNAHYGTGTADGAKA